MWKTKELVVDFCRCRHPPPSVSIQGTHTERVDSYKYLGVHMNNKLVWTDNTVALYKKGRRRLHILKKLRSFGVQGELLRTFYDSVVASAIFYGVVYWADTFSSRQVFVSVCLTVGGGYRIFGSGTKLSVTDEQVVKPVVSVYPAASRAHLEGSSSLLCVASAMFPPLVQFSWKRQKKNGGLEELPPAEGEQLELREPGHRASILLIPQNSTWKHSCSVKHEGGTVEAQTQEELPAPAASCPPEREPADLPALQPADWSFQSQCRVKLLCLLSTVLIVKSLVYCCGLSLLMILRNKGASTNCTHAD
ncbi:uncharacterized protein LOC115777673 [Archocentrus centrarchus]|uniref:uncharacterized protein LOC115777673 n=1 Tax=Archocentrus centrarchus TaxID=63155 RepID=UPI0011E9E81F|nr:uncharacterized protein LOC115777673 [Archocentrus centrarchus]